MFNPVLNAAADRIPQDPLERQLPIVSFADKDTEAMFFRGRVRRFAQIERQAYRKLHMLNAAVDLRDLRAPPGNRLEALEGGLAGLHSIRVNKRWRICFVWTDEGPDRVEIVDYH